MSQRRTKTSNIFTEQGAGAVTDQIFATSNGAMKEFDSGRRVDKSIDIFTIRPNPTQPRRAIPSLIRDQWNGDPHTIKDTLSQWWGLIQNEVGELDLVGCVIRDDACEYPETVGPVTQRLFDLAVLANSIYRDGLTNPITIAKQGDGYILETGERRWLAFHMLYWFTQDEKWSKIPAYVPPEYNVWRQATENNLRQNLNLISRARQYAILMMALHPDQSFAPYPACHSDREFYAQVLPLGTPYGERKKLLGALGVNSPAQLTVYRKALELNDENWTLADDEDWSENKLFGIPNNLQKSQKKADSTPKNDPHKVVETRKKMSQLGLVLNRAGERKLNKRTRQAALGQVQELREWLDRAEQILNAQADD